MALRRDLFTLPVACGMFVIVSPAALAQVSGSPQEILVLSTSEDAGGTTQADLSPDVLRMIGRRSVDLLEAKMVAYLNAQGQSAQLPKLQSEAHFLEAGAAKLAVDRVKYVPTGGQPSLGLRHSRH